MSYNIHGTGASRLLVVPMREAHRWRFMQVKDEQAVRVKFTQAGKRLLAVVSDTVLVYKKPHANAFHYEYMQANRGALSRGEAGADSDIVLDNLLEYVGTL